MRQQLARLQDEQQQNNTRLERELNEVRVVANAAASPRHAATEGDVTG